MTEHGELRRYHSAVLVPDITAAVGGFTASTGVRFGEVMTFPIRVESDAEEIDIDVTFVHAVDGRTELIQASEGPFAPAVGFGLHHVGGIGTVELDEEIEVQDALGSGVEWRLYMEGRLFAVFLEPTPLRPVRVEVMAPFMANA